MPRAPRRPRQPCVPEECDDAGARTDPRPLPHRAPDRPERRLGADDPRTGAEIRAWRGEADAAFAWLGTAVARRDPLMSGLETDFLMSSLESDPRWNALLVKIGLPTD